MKVTLKDHMGSDLTGLSEDLGSYKLFSPIYQRELAYVAGVIEGEGCFVASKDKRDNRLSCKIQVEMSDKDVIDRINTLFPGRIYHLTNKPHSHYKETWRWCLYRQQDVFNCLIEIMPLLSSRRLAKASEVFSILEPRVIKCA